MTQRLAWKCAGCGIKTPDLVRACDCVTDVLFREISGRLVHEIKRPWKGASMRLTAKQVPHSSVVGGGLTLCDANGRARFIVNFMGTTAGIRPEETKALAEQFAHYVNNHDVVVPDRGQ